MGTLLPTMNIKGPLHTYVRLLYHINLLISYLSISYLEFKKVRHGRSCKKNLMYTVERTRGGQAIV